ncbi:MAG: hypothetical protein EOO73_30255 [Myxococcales bacterium]|nr:MAG: hypothetical protein EOO73_30255 [Myxococcales bacterium]
MSKGRVSFGFSAWFWLGGALAACGSLNSGVIEIVEGDDGGTGGKGNGGTSTSGGDSSAAGTGEPSGGSPDGEGGEPPIVISDDPPTIVSISPEDEAEAVEPTTKVVIEFSETLNEDSLDGAIVIKEGDEEVDTKLTFAGTKATLTFARRLDLLATYTVNVSADVTDLAGNALESDFSSSFTVREGTWGSFVTLSNPTTSGRVDSGPFAVPVLDAAGNALAVWAQQDGADGPSVIWGRFYRRGRGWQAAVKLSTATTGCSMPSASMNASGDAVVAWEQGDTGNYTRVFARRFLSGAWEATPLRVDVSNVADVSGVTTAMTETGDAHVLWQYASTYRYVAGNNASGAGEWKASDTYISGQFDSLGGPKIAFNSSGAGFAVWVGSNGTASTVRVARYLTATGWGNIESIAGSAGATTSYQGAPDIAADANGGAMAVWNRSADIASSRFTKATGWSDIALADGAASGTVANWQPRLASFGSDFIVHWHQSVGSITNAFANVYTGGAWGAQPLLLSDGDTPVFEWSETGFGLDRHANGLAVWVQGSQVRFARLVGSERKWSADALVQTLGGDPTEARTGVGPSGVAAVVASTGYPYYERHDDLFAGIFE